MCQSRYVNLTGAGPCRSPKKNSGGARSIGPRFALDGSENYPPAGKLKYNGESESHPRGNRSIGEVLN